MNFKPPASTLDELTAYTFKTGTKCIPSGKSWVKYMVNPQSYPIEITTPLLNCKGMEFDRLSGNMYVTFNDSSEWVKMQNWLAHLASRWMNSKQKELFDCDDLDADDFKKLDQTSFERYNILMDNMEPSLEVYRKDGSILYPSRFDLANPFKGKLLISIRSIMINLTNKKFKWELNAEQLLLSTPVILPVSEHIEWCG